MLCEFMLHSKCLITLITLQFSHLFPQSSFLLAKTFMMLIDMLTQTHLGCEGSITSGFLTDEITIIFDFLNLAVLYKLKRRFGRNLIIKC